MEEFYSAALQWEHISGMLASVQMDFAYSQY